MKQCTECGAKNTNSAKICNDCGSDIIIFSIGSKKNSEKKEKQRKEREKLYSKDSVVDAFNNNRNKSEKELETLEKIEDELETKTLENETDSSSPEVNISTVSIDEAVGYGFDMFQGIAKYIIFIFILNGVGFFLFLAGIADGSAIFLFGIPLIIAGIVLNIALSIGVIYKLWVDILARSRK